MSAYALLSFSRVNFSWMSAACPNMSVRYAQKETNILRNIYRIIVAQKKTANYMEKLAFCLKKYMLYDKNIINAIDKEISMTHERYERNKKLITEWTIDFGLESLVEQIQSDYSTDIFGHAALIHEKFTYVVFLYCVFYCVFNVDSLILGICDHCVRIVSIFCFKKCFHVGIILPKK